MRVLGKKGARSARDGGLFRSVRNDGIRYFGAIVTTPAVLSMVTLN